ncbi:hypothetical protein EW093_10420 [Thiospirochaeta perfilievii]|uniref:Uncharacterized protein n=1 Tax=Thiospirochaeta perfilievii TaxID=252967 RepID=A0A5C1QCC1_9SPIO|nr:hypothetical protein [Thiospirochaeta perfilievii]QEN05107.1 hypothetical protein EW093_10420 [Thiospirochaeta perfilievii]
MTENDLKIELMCYKEYVNPDCDIDNMTKDELEEFYNLYVKSESYMAEVNTASSLNNKSAKVLKEQDVEIPQKREGAIYKY